MTPIGEVMRRRRRDNSHKMRHVTNKMRHITQLTKVRNKAALIRKADNSCRADRKKIIADRSSGAIVIRLGHRPKVSNASAGQSRSRSIEPSKSYIFGENDGNKLHFT